MISSRCTVAAIVFSVVVCCGYPASAYIGEGVQGRPHGGAKAAVRAYNFRHGLGYTRHPYRTRHLHR